MAEISANKRIAKNTLMLYFRQILIMGVSLYTVRVVLDTLGAVDYGIYNVVAGVVTMFSFLSGAMATASQRYFSFDLGKKDYGQLRKTFGVTLCIYLLLILIVVVLAETVGLWFVYNKLVIPADRVNAARWIYHASIISFVFTILTTPYMAAIIAHEDMNIYAYVSILEVILKLAIVFILPLFGTDKLVLYGILMAAVVIINTTVYRTICRKKYEECRAKLQWDTVLFKELLSYTSWNMFGAAVGVFKFQGVGIVINQFFGPIVNASRAIAMQINSAVNSFSQNFSIALRPQIIKHYAQNEKNEMLELTFRGMRFTFYLMFVLSIPLIFNMDQILTVWLKKPPAGVVIFAQLTLIDAIIESISYTLGTAIQAVGKIKLYQFVVGSFLLLNLPISYFFVYLGFSVEIVYYISIIITVLALICRLFFMKHLVSFSFNSKFVTTNFFRMFFSVVSVLSVIMVYNKISNLHFIFDIFIQYILSLLIVFFMGLKKNEKVFFMEKLCKKK